METIAHGTLTDAVFNHLRDKILQGELKRGDRLSGIEIADRLGVSRTPVREACSRLVIAGLAYKKSRIEFCVKEVSVAELVELYLARAALEGVAVRIAIDFITTDEIKRLAEILDRMEHEEPNLENSNELNRLNNEFHEIIIAASHTTLLAEEIMKYVQRSEQYRVLGYHLPGRHLQSCREHRKIYKMIVAKKKDEAEKAMREHRINTVRHITKSLGKEISP